MEGRVSQKGSRSLLGKRKNLFLAGKRSLKTGEPDRNVNKNIGPQKSPQKLSFIFLSQRREYKFFKT
jgi:hypothetical protein